MNNTLKRMATKLALVNAMTTCTMRGNMYYDLAERKPRATTEEDNKFVEKQGYKEPGKRDRAEQYKRKLKRKAKNYKGHKHGGAKK